MTMLKRFKIDFTIILKLEILEDLYIYKKNYYFFFISNPIINLSIKIYLITQILCKVCNDIASLFWFVAKGIFGDKAILIASG